MSKSIQWSPRSMLAAPDGRPDAGAPVAPRPAGPLERAWVAGLLLMMTGALMPLLRRTQDERAPLAGEETGDPFQQAVWLGMYAITLLLALRFWRTALRHFLADRLLALMLVWAALSIAWSDIPLLTAQRVTALLLTSMVGYYLATRFTLAEVLRLLAWVMLLAMALSVVFIVALPELGLMTERHIGAWRGIYVHKNTLGRAMMLAALVFVVLLCERRWRLASAIVLASSLVILHFADSATALVSVATLALVVPLYQLLRMHPSLAIPGIWLGLGGMCVALVWGMTDLETWLLAMGRDPTLTGRTALWSALLELGAQRPWAGSGYGTFWSTQDGAAEVAAMAWAASHSHNGFIEVWLDLGAVGVALLLCHLGTTMIRGLRLIIADRSAAALFPAALLAMLIIRNVAEHDLFDHHNVFWALYVFAAIKVRTAQRDQPLRVTDGFEAQSPGTQIHTPSPRTGA